MRATIFLMTVFVAAVSSSMAAEIRLKATAIPKSPLVRLGDVAEIFSNNPREAERLANLELVPAPSQGEARFLRPSEVQEIIAARGVNLASHVFSGASVVRLAEHETEVRDSFVRASQRDRQRAKQLASEAIRRYLFSVASDDSDWKIDVELDDADAVALTRSGGTLIATGGKEPWLGTQRFELAWANRRQGERLSLSAQVTLPVAVVSAIRPIPRGSMISSSDVILQSPTSGHRVEDAVFHRIDQVVGKEATRNISAGQALSAQTVRPPILVHRGDVVTVYARVSGVTVRTSARARQNGSQGELIAIESFDRDRYFARVTGPQEVDVYAAAQTIRPPSVESTVTDSLSHSGSNSRMTLQSRR